MYTNLGEKSRKVIASKIKDCREFEVEQAGGGTTGTSNKADIARLLGQREGSRTWVQINCFSIGGQTVLMIYAN
jgi:hypothetical protein